MKNNNYSKKLTDPRWQKKRLELLELHSWKCEQCGDTKSELHVHHRFYIKGRQVWEYDNDVFQVLCHVCHDKEHNKNDKSKKKLPDLYQEIIKSLEKCDDIDPQNSRYIYYILKGYLNVFDDDQFFRNLGYLVDTPHIEKIKYELESLAFNEEVLIELQSRINALESWISKSENNG